MLASKVLLGAMNPPHHPANRLPAPPTPPLPMLSARKGNTSGAAGLNGMQAGASTSAAGGSNPRVNTLVWLRQDLRRHDNPAITAAARLANNSGGCVTFLYVHSPEEDGEASGSGGPVWRPGAATLLWLHHALDSLDKSLVAKYGASARIVYRKGPYASVVSEVSAGQLYVSEAMEG